jgi:hypothetical protein
MPKRSRTARPHPASKPKTRAVSKAHREERDENQAAFDLMQRVIEHTETRSSSSTTDSRETVRSATARRDS